MSAKVESPPVKTSHESTLIPRFHLSHHGSSDSHSTGSPESSSPRGLPRDESSGLISSLMSVAHNAANMMKTKHGNSVEASNDQITPKESSPEKPRPSETHTRSSGGSNYSFVESTKSPSKASDSISLSPSNVHFEPVHKSPIHTLGDGDLSLVHFEKKEPIQRSFSESVEVPVKGGPFMTDSSSNKLFVTGNSDSKVIRRNTISNVSIADSLSSEGTIDTNGDDNHTFDPSEFSNLELEQILNSNKFPIHPKKDKEFHHTFKKIPANEHLLADFSCALSRDILVQGKMYLSPHYICFNSNILGWVTNIVVPIPEIIQIEKKSTAVLFPNGMVIRTLHQKYVFATFLSRDSTFNMITQVWHNALQDGAAPDEIAKSKKGSQKRKSVSRRSTVDGSEMNDGLDSDDSLGESEDEDKLLHSSDENDLTFISRSSERSRLKDLKKTRNAVYSSESGSESDVEGTSSNSALEMPPSEKKNGKFFKGFMNPGPQSHAPTVFEHEKTDGEVEILQHTFNAPLGVVYNILYGPDSSTFIRVLEEGKNFDISKEKITELNLSHKEREYSYTKPLSGPIGPKQTKCNITETVHKYDFSNYCELEQVTKTPDVPSGNSFKIRTRFFFSWGPGNSTKLTVYTSVDWSAKSWIKSAVEKGSMDGQKTSMKVLTDTISDILSNGGSGASKKKRRRTKSGSQAALKVAETAPEEVKPVTISSQILGIMDQVGSSVPIQIPMISDTITGGIVLFVISLLYSYILTFLLGGRSNHVGGSPSSKMAFSDDGRYVLMPSSEFYLRDEQQRRQNEAQLWDWIVTRTGSESPAAAARGHDVNEKYADENFKEMMRMTKKRIDAAYLNLI